MQGREKPKGREWGLRKGFRTWSDGKLSTDSRLPRWRSVLALLSLASDVAAFTVILAVLRVYGSVEKQSQALIQIFPTIYSFKKQVLHTENRDLNWT